MGDKEKSSKLIPSEKRKADDGEPNKDLKKVSLSCFLNIVLRNFNIIS